MRKSIILTVCLSILTALFTHLSPISYAEDSTAILYDGTAQSFLLLNENETEVLSLSKVTDEGSIYQWEILIDEENGAWVELENQNDDQYEAVYETLKELAGEDDTVQLRCKVTTNEEVSYSNVLSVELFSHDSKASLFNLDSESTESEGLDEYETELIEDEVVEGQEPVEEEETLTWLSYSDFLYSQSAYNAWYNPYVYVGLTAEFNVSSYVNFQLSSEPENEVFAYDYDQYFDDESESNDVEEIDESKYIDSEEVEGLRVVITDYYINEDDPDALLWFKVEASEGYTLPEKLVNKPYVLFAIYDEDIPALIMPPTEGMFIGEEVVVKNNVVAASNFITLSTEGLPDFFSVTPCTGDGLNFYDLGDITSWSPEITSSNYRYVAESSVVLIPAEVTAAYNRLINAESSQEYAEIYNSIPEFILDMFTEKHVQNTEDHSAELIRIENVEINTSTTINGVDVPVKVKGKIPATATLSVTPVTNETVQSEGFKVAVEDIVLALDIKIYNEGVEWQPEEGFPVELMIDMASLGYEDGSVVELRHKHDGQIYIYEIFVVEEGKITYITDGFSMYVVNSTTSTAKVEEIQNNGSDTLYVGQEIVYYFDHTNNNYNTQRTGTWIVEDPSGAIHYTVHTNTAVGNSGMAVRWIKIVALRETTTPIKLTYTYRTVDRNNTFNDSVYTQTFTLNVVPPKATGATTDYEDGGRRLYIKDLVNTTGTITAALVDTNGQEIEDGLLGASFAWERDDDLFIVPYAYKDDYKSIDIARDHAGLVEARMKADKTGYSPVTYTLTVTLLDGTVLKDSYTVYYQSEIINSSFEFPNAPDGTYTFFPNGYPELYWKTTAPGKGRNLTKDVEYGSVKGGDAAGFNINSASDGDQFAELNAEEFGALYQDIITVPSAQGSPEYIEWDFAHAARSQLGNTNNMFLIFGPTEQAQKLLTQADLAPLGIAAKGKLSGTERNEFLAGKRSVTVEYSCNGGTAVYEVWYHSVSTSQQGDWLGLKGSYQVPENQHRTRVFFVTDTEGVNNNNKNYGNLIDVSKAGQYKDYLVEYYVEEYENEQLKLEYFGEYTEDDTAIVYSSQPLQNYDHFEKELNNYLYKILINGELYPYDIRYKDTPSIYIDKYPGAGAVKPEIHKGGPNNNDYSEYDFVVQIYFRSTVVAVEKNLVLPSDYDVNDNGLIEPSERGMTEEQKLSLLTELNKKGGYKTDFVLTSVDAEFEDETKSTTITNRDPAGNYKGYVAMGDNIEIEGGKEYQFIVEELPPENPEGLELSQVRFEIRRYAMGNNIGELAMTSYTIINVDDLEHRLVTNPITLGDTYKLSNGDEVYVKIADVTVTNTYKEKESTVYYAAVGKGKVAMADSGYEDNTFETLKYYSGKAEGVIATAGKGATFDGWYKDAECTIPVEPQDGVDSQYTDSNGVVHYTYKPNSNIKGDKAYFYAKFVTGSIEINRTNAEPNDVFVYKVVNGKTGADQVEFYVTVQCDEHGNGTTVIHEVADGTYTVTEMPKNAWRYQGNDFKTVSYEYDTETKAPARFDFSRVAYNLKWLNDFSEIVKNVFTKAGGGS